MRYLIDTDYLIDATGDDRRATEALERLSAHGLAVSIISYGEICEGAFADIDPDRILSAYRLFLADYSILPLSEEIMERFAHTRAYLRRTGQLIPDLDLLIAATAIHHNLHLVTRNLRHFARVPGLSIYEDA